MTIAMRPLHLAAALVFMLAVVPAAGDEQRRQVEEILTRIAELHAGKAIPVDDFDGLEPLFEAMADRRHVLLGESTHGTHEYYYYRARISQRLIDEEGFDFVGIEGDWQNIYRVNEYVKHLTDEAASAREALSAHSRWPQWMWENEEFEEFVEWLRDFNADRPEGERVGLYGLDLQDPRDSMRAVIAWFEEHKEDQAPEVAEAYECLKRFEGGLGDYARHLHQGGTSCEDEVRAPVDILRTALEQEPDWTSAWAAKQNALAVKEAEKQHRSMLLGGAHSWNHRARHMHDTFVRLADHYGPGSRGIVWAHNTHVGDSSMTEMVERGEVNIGHLLRESAGDENVFILGFGSHTGTVIAGETWDVPHREMDIVDSHPQSWEGILERSGKESFLIVFGERTRARENLVALPQRAIGVVYNPPGEAYVGTILPLRYDAFIFIRETRALTPFED